MKNEELSRAVGRMMRKQLIDDPGMLMENDTVSKIKATIRGHAEESEEVMAAAMKTIDWKIVMEAADAQSLKELSDKIYENQSQYLGDD